MKARRRQWMADTNDRIDDFGALDEPPHVHCYLTHCLAAAVGFKFVDAARRVCVYTRPRHPQKTFFAVIRRPSTGAGRAVSKGGACRPR